MGLRSVRCGFLDPVMPDVEVSLPAVVRRVGAFSSFAVVTFGDVELELNDSSKDFVGEYFDAAGAVPEDQIVLGSGHAVTVGRVAGGGGHCFAVHAGERCLLGTTPPKVSLTTLAGWLAGLQVTPRRTGLKVRPVRARWSQVRPPHAVLVLALRSGQRVLLDVRPAYRPSRKPAAGLAVAGGRLSRVTPPDRPAYLTLDAPDHVVHVLPPTADHLDEVAELGAHVSVRPLAG
jgi:hypothetical protein